MNNNTQEPQVEEWKIELSKMILISGGKLEQSISKYIRTLLEEERKMIIKTAANLHGNLTIGDVQDKIWASERFEEELKSKYLTKQNDK